MERLIQRCSAPDLDVIFELYEWATRLQVDKKTVVVWPAFDRSMVKQEIREGHQWKLIDEGRTACVWATSFSDPQIWEEKNEDPAVYIHRIAVHPEFRGRNYVRAMVDWAKSFAVEQGKRFVRLDTLGHNPKLIEHYTRSGFTFLGRFTLKDTSCLPDHYKQHSPALLFEIDLENKKRSNLLRLFYICICS